MTRLIGRRLAHDRIPIGTDRVVAAFPVPRNGTFNSLNLAIDMIALDGQSLSSDKMVAYGVSAYVVPIADPDAALAFETAWDQLIPKDHALGGIIDIDTGDTDDTAAFEPGQVNTSAIFDMVGLQPRQIFKRRKYLTYAHNGAAVGGAALDNWHPNDAFVTRINQSVRCSMYSYVLVGVSSPAFDTTGTTAWAPPTESQWGILQYLDIFIENMFIASLNMEEPGAESPYEDAEAFITELLEDTIFEDTADAFHPLIWNCFCRSTFDISVEGRRQLKTLTSEMN